MGLNNGTLYIASSYFNPHKPVGFDENHNFVGETNGETHIDSKSFYNGSLGDSQGTNASGYSNWRLSAELGDGWTFDSYTQIMPVMTEYSLEGEGTEGKPYLIANADDWAYLARMVNGNGHFSQGKYFKMTGDVSTNIPMGIATPAKPFEGIFDGDGHTLDVEFYYKDDFSAPFGCINGATITGLKVTGRLFGGQHTGGLVGTSPTDASDNVISNCRVSTVVATTSDYAGGIMGHGLFCQRHL